VLAARIASLRDIGNGQVDVHLACGRARLTARITQASTARLMLKPGEMVFAVLKSVILDPRALRGVGALE
jgi:molybdopterin-binding protein